MSAKMLVAAFHPVNQKYVQHAKESGMMVRVLDCVESEHKRLVRRFGDEVLSVQGTRGQVKRAVAAEGFDIAVVHEGTDFVLAALITQSLREAGVPQIVVVTADSSRTPMYRRLGAHQIVQTSCEDEAFAAIDRLLPKFATA